MSRVITASEVDRLHAQVAELTERVYQLEHPQFTEFFEDPETALEPLKIPVTTRVAVAGLDTDGVEIAAPDSSIPPTDSAI